MRVSMHFRLLVASLALIAAPAFADEFVQDTRGAFLHGTYQLDTWGKGIPLQLGVQWAGIRTYADRKHLFTFDAAGNLFAAYGGNSNERFYLLGGQLRGLGEFGLRLMSERNLSFYLGATGLFSGSAVSSLGTPLDQYNRMSSLDGIAGLYGVAALRLNAGVSVLHENHALLVTVFAGESARRPGSPASGALYTDFGIRAQFDIVRSFTATLEGSWGTTFGRLEPVFGVTNSATRYELTASVRKMIGPIWLALDGQLHGAGNTATYTAGSNVYVTATPTFASVGLTFGVSL